MTLHLTNKNWNFTSKTLDSKWLSLSQGTRFKSSAEERIEFRNVDTSADSHLGWQARIWPQRLVGIAWPNGGAANLV
jgi:hypothetical protein